MAIDQRAVPWMQAFKAHLVACTQMATGCTEGVTSHVCHEHSGCRHVAPSAMARAQAEVVFLAIALGEHVVAERADIIETGTLHVETKAHTDRDLDRRTSI